MTDTTHAQGCWDWGPRHYECAAGQIERDEALLSQALEALDSDHSDIQLRTAIALRERLGVKA